MYKVKENVMVSDFSKETKDFLLKIGFKDTDNMSEIFQNMLDRKGYSLNEKYTSKVKLCNLGGVSQKISFGNDYGVTIYCQSHENSNECDKNIRTIAKEKFNKIINSGTKKNTYKLGEVYGS